MTYGIRLEYSTPYRFILVKELRNLSIDRQWRIAKAWKKAAKILSERNIGKTAFYVSEFYHGV